MPNTRKKSNGNPFPMPVKQYFERRANRIVAMYDSGKMTLGEIAWRVGLSRQRVHQIYHAAKRAGQLKAAKRRSK